ncbi:MAG: dienelactone hydrolase family protein [Deltaproteobacteria bacterium]|nr:dienelactone hydrolase family protein [Nannocystaceae bacterium]
MITACQRRAATTTTQPPTPTTSEHGQMPVTGMVDEEEFKRMHELRGDAAPASTGVWIELAGGSKAYLSLPPGAKAPLPAIVVIHEWWGLNDHMRHWTDRLAADGYAALAVDLYGGKVATTSEEAMALTKGVDDAQAREVLAAAHAFLRDDPRVAAKKRGVIGWCFGGGWALQQAIAQPELDAAVIYYGRLVLDPAPLAKIHAELLGVFGDRDHGIPPAAVDEFVAALQKAGKTIEIHRYDAEHAFANPSGSHYDTVAAADAWSHVRTFFDRTLR